MVSPTPSSERDCGFPISKGRGGFQSLASEDSSVLPFLCLDSLNILESFVCPAPDVVTGFAGQRPARANSSISEDRCRLVLGLFQRDYRHFCSTKFNRSLPNA